jgi:hypothetical protein
VSQKGKSIGHMGANEQIDTSHHLHHGRIQKLIKWGVDYLFNKYYIKFNYNLYEFGSNYTDIKLFYINLFIKTNLHCNYTFKL